MEGCPELVPQGSGQLWGQLREPFPQNSSQISNHLLGILRGCLSRRQLTTSEREFRMQVPPPPAAHRACPAATLLAQ